MRADKEEVFHSAVRHWHRFAQRGEGYPIPGDSQGQVGWGSEQLMELQVSPFNTGSWIRWALRICSNSNDSVKKICEGMEKKKMSEAQGKR